jgi:hypothetical protein
MVDPFGVGLLKFKLLVLDNKELAAVFSSFLNPPNTTPVWASKVREAGDPSCTDTALIGGRVAPKIALPLATAAWATALSSAC